MKDMQLFNPAWRSKQGWDLAKSISFLLRSIGSHVPTDIVVKTIHANLVAIVPGLSIRAVASCLQALCASADARQ